MEELFMKKDGAFIVIAGIHGEPQGRFPPGFGGKGPVQGKDLSVVVQIGADMFPFAGKNRVPFGAEQGAGIHRFDPGPEGKAAVTGVTGAEAFGFGIEGLRGVGKHKRIVSGGPYYPLYAETAYGDTVAGKDIRRRSG
jgi:hypothetical protein